MEIEFCADFKCCHLLWRLPAIICVLQHFLDHDGECNFSEILSTMNVRKCLVPANRLKIQSESNVAFDFPLPWAEEQRRVLRKDSTSACFVICHFT